MEGQPSIYDLLAKKSLSDVTVTDINTAMARTKTDTASFDFWQGVLMLQAAISAGRTYGHGLPIPEASNIETQTVADGGTFQLKPPSPEMYQVVGIFAGATTLSLTDGSGATPVPMDSSGNLYSPIIITPTLFLNIDNASGGSVSIAIAYHKVSL
jgi:hypothetical protein